MPLCLSCYDVSTDMQHDLPGSFIRSGHLTWPQVIFQIDLSGSKWTSFESTWHKDYYSVKDFTLPFYLKKKIAITLILPQAAFLFGQPWKGQNVTLGSKLGYGWIQNFLYILFVFVAKLNCKFVAFDVGVRPPPPGAFQDGEIACEYEV